MGDHYQPSYGRDGDRDRGYGYRDYGREHERDPQSSNYYNNGTSGGYTFRGAADRDSYRPPPQDFTFRATGPPAPRLPPSDIRSYASQGPPQGRSRRADERGRSRRQPQAQRNDGAYGQQRRGGFRGRGRPAHTRDILRSTGRETTPEQLEGMNADGQIHFKDVESSSSDEDDIKVVDLTHTSDDDSAAPRKRTKLDVPAESAAPKWSNPDPYTVLPPVDTLGAPKKDIVQVIRKAKVDSEAKASAQKANNEADFISLNFDDPMDDDDEGDEEEGEDEGDFDPPPNAPSGPAPKFNAINAGLPPPPPGFVMPSDEELMAQMAGVGKNRKRKFDDQAVKGAEDVLEEWESVGGDCTPWCKIDHSLTANTGLRLHKEICDFYEFVRPYDYEEAVRRELISRVLQATKRSNTRNAKNVDVQCFGSFAAGLYLPTADMDLVAVSPEYLSRSQKTYCQTGTQMHNLARFLEQTGVAAPGGVAVISKAKVPIVKFADKRTGIKVDISFENDSGLYANRTFQDWKAQYPAMPVIVVLIKQMLAMRGLNEVFSGGIGGFTVICLVVSMMQLMPDLQSGAMDPELHYADLLLNFLDLYGNKFDIRKTGITMDPPGYFDKVLNPSRKQNATRLTIMDPNRPDNDISGGSSRIDDVLDVFRTAHSKLQRRLAQVHAGDRVKESILGCVWGGNYGSFIKQREKLSMLHRGYAISPPPPPPAPVPRKQKAAKRGPPPSNGQGMAHPLPAKPNGAKINSAKSAAAKTRQQTQKARMREKRKMSDVQKQEDTAARWKRRHPEIKDVPDRMTGREKTRLNQKYGFT